MSKIIGFFISAIFFFGYGKGVAFQVKKVAIQRVHKGLPSLGSFTQKMTRKNFQND